MPPLEPPTTSSLRRGLVALMLAHASVDIAMGVWTVYKTLAGLDLAIAGLVATAAGFTANASQIGFGLAADRGWQRMLLVVGVLLTGAVFWLPMASGWPVMALIVFSASIGSSMFHPAGAAWAGAVSAQRTGLFVALFLVGGYLGTASSQALFSAVWLRCGPWTAGLYVLPVLTAAALAATVRGQPRARAPLAATFGLIRQHRRELGVLFALQVTSTTSVLALMFLLPDLLASRSAPLWLVAGAGHAALVLGACAALVPAGHLADRLGPRLVLGLGNALSGLALAAILLLPTAGPVVVLILLAIFGCMNAANNPVIIASGNRVMPGQGAAASALLMGLPWCVAAVAPFIGGVLADPRHGGSPASAIAWLGLSIPLSLLIGWWLPGRKADPRSSP